MENSNRGGGTLKLVLIGVGAMFLYSRFGAVGLIVAGVVCLLMADRV